MRLPNFLGFTYCPSRISILKKDKKKTLANKLLRQPSMYTSKHFLSKCTQDPHKYSYDKNTGAVNSLNRHSSSTQKWEPPKIRRDQANIQKDVQLYMLPAPQQSKKKNFFFFSHTMRQWTLKLSVNIFMTPVDNLKSQCWYLFSRHVRIFILIRILALENFEVFGPNEQSKLIGLFSLKMMCMWCAKQI